MAEQVVLQPGLGIEPSIALGATLKWQPYGFLSKWTTVEDPNVAFKIQRLVEHCAFLCGAQGKVDQLNSDCGRAIPG